MPPPGVALQHQAREETEVSEVDVQHKPLGWRTSSFSNGGGCGEVGPPLGGGLMALRDSKNPRQGYFVHNAHEWHSFLQGVRAGSWWRGIRVGLRR